jgi:hypothetical protein
VNKRGMKHFLLFYEGAPELAAMLAWPNDL